MDDLVVTVGGKTLLYVAEGETLDLPVALALEGAVAPGTVSLALDSVTGDGSNQISWYGGAQSILAGESESDGCIRIVGGSGVNTVVLETGATFAETQDDSVTLTVVGYPGWLAVDPVRGNDETGIGTVAAPFRSATHAISILKAGEEVRLLPGTYSSATETFPWLPGSVRVVGWDPEDPDGAVSNVVVTGSNASTILAHFLLGDTGFLANLTFADTAAHSVQADASTLVVSNVVFTQSVENFGTGGAICLQDDAAVTARDCVFTGIRRLCVVGFLMDSANNGNVFTAERCVFRDNLTNYGLVSGTFHTMGFPQVHFRAYDTLFENCDSLGYYVSDSYSGALFYARSSGTVYVDRCRILGCDNGALFAINYVNPCEIRNTLIAGCSLNAGIFDGSGNPQAVIRNCTVTGTSGGFNCFDVVCAIANSVIVGNGELSFVRRDLTGREDVAWHQNRPIYIYDSIVWDTDPGLYTAEMEAAWTTNLRRIDPLLKRPLSYAAGETNLWASVDAYPRSGSPVFDTGSNTHVLAESSLDLDGTARIRPCRPNLDAIVDVGCYETDRPDFGTLLILR